MQARIQIPQKGFLYTYDNIKYRLCLVTLTAGILIGYFGAVGERPTEEKTIKDRFQVQLKEYSFETVREIIAINCGLASVRSQLKGIVSRKFAILYFYCYHWKAKNILHLLFLSHF
jgi:hypothetical protein